MSDRYDVAILGSGFSGSMLAKILCDRGRRVVLLDHASHPRFAIGESSTPLADGLLKYLADVHDQPTWKPLATYGSWKPTYPHLGCGLKRGFTYYRHLKHQPWAAATPDNRLMVAASRSDHDGDTHWYRQDVDRFFHDQAVAAGVASLIANVTDVSPGRPSRINATLIQSHRPISIVADWVVDATGRSAVSAGLLGRPDHADRLLTKTRCRFGHVIDLPRFESVNPVADADPFDPEAAAVHHLLDEGWMWCLRFDNGITSIGITTPLDAAEMSFDRLRSDYPGLQRLLEPCRFVIGPVDGGRLQRRFDPRIDDRFALTPTTATTLDPLHSTGIASSLSGVARLADLILKDQTIGDDYVSTLRREVDLLDRLVSTAYASLPDFDRFAAACMIYFIVAIASEERVQAGSWSANDCLYQADQTELMAAVIQSCDLLRHVHPTAAAVNAVRRRMSPFNHVGLFDPAAQNRYAYTATK